MSRQTLTLCIPRTHDQVLLGMKKHGFGSGRWNSFGGKVEAGESIEEGARRELQEEVGIQDGTLKKYGILEFSFKDREMVLEVHVFALTNFTDTPVETNEMRPHWFYFDEIPFAQMWPDDELWLPLLWEQNYFIGEFLFDRPADAKHPANILEERLQVVSQLPKNS